MEQQSEIHITIPKKPDRLHFLLGLVSIKRVIFVTIVFAWLVALLFLVDLQSNQPRLQFEYKAEQLPNKLVDQGWAEGFRNKPETDSLGNKYLWTGTQSTIYFDFQLRKAYKVGLELRSAAVAGGPDRPVRVLINGTEVAQLRPDPRNPDFQRFEIKVTPSASEQHNIELTLVADRFAAPGDTRVLGTMLKRITLDKEEVWSSVSKWNWLLWALLLVLGSGSGLLLLAHFLKRPIFNYLASLVFLTGSGLMLGELWIVSRVGVFDPKFYPYWLSKIIYLAVICGVTVLLILVSQVWVKKQLLFVSYFGQLLASKLCLPIYYRLQSRFKLLLLLLVWLGAALAFGQFVLYQPKLKYDYLPQQLNTPLENGQPTGFYPVEQDEQGRNFAWTNGRASILFDMRLNKPVNLHIDLKSAALANGPDVPVAVLVNGVEQARLHPDPANPNFQTFKVEITPPYLSQQFLEVALLPRTFEAQDGRVLGTIVGKISLDKTSAWPSLGLESLIVLALPGLLILGYGLGWFSKRRLSSLRYVMIGIFALSSALMMVGLFLFLQTGMIDRKLYVPRTLSFLYLIGFFALLAGTVPLVLRKHSSRNLFTLLYYWFFPARRWHKPPLIPRLEPAEFKPMLLRTGKRLVRESGILVLYGVLSLALLSPIASLSEALPKGSDAQYHWGYIVQARQALEEGQFPPRVTPMVQEGMRYPGLQFYGQLPETFGGLIYKFLTPDSFYAAYLIVFWLAMLVGGYYMYRLVSWFTRSRPVAILVGAIYLSAPYFLTSQNAEGMFTECSGQGLLALVLYLSLRCYTLPRVRPVFWCGLAWFALGATHTITFAYLTLYMGLLLAMLGFTRQKSWQRLGRVGLAFGIGLALGLYYQLPVILKSKEIFLNRGLQLDVANPFKNPWHPSIAGLLSPQALPVEPINDRTSYIPFRPSLGWLLLAGALAALYYYFSLHPIKWPTSLRRTRFLIMPLTTVTLVTLFMSWSPFDFWEKLPTFFLVVQIPVRLLTHVIWPASLLSAFALVLAFKRFDIRYVWGGIFLIGLANGSSLPAVENSGLSKAALLNKPTIGPTAETNYLYYIDGKVNNYFGGISEELFGGQELKLYDDANHLVGHSAIGPTGPVAFLENTLPSWRPGDKPVLHFEGDLVYTDLWKTIFDRPVLYLEINGTRIASYHFLKDGSFSWDIPLDQVPITGKYFSLNFTGNHLSPISVRSLRINGLPPERSVVSLETAQNIFHTQGDKVVGQVTLKDPLPILQVPILFYPDMLEVKVDGQEVPYLPVLQQFNNINTLALNRYIVGLRLSPGIHQVETAFVGLPWTNWVSLISWLLVLIILFGPLLIALLRVGWKAIPTQLTQTAGPKVLVKA